MKKAQLYCPREKVFFNELLIERPVIPNQSNQTSDTITIEVEVLEIDGEQALVILPNIMTSDERTALVNIQNLNLY